MDNILTRKQAMAYLAIGKDLLHKLTTTGEIQSHKIGRYRRYRQEHLDAYIRRREEVNSRTIRAAWYEKSSAIPGQGHSYL